MTPVSRSRPRLLASLLPLLMLAVIQSSGSTSDDGFVLQLGEPAVIVQGAEAPPLAVLGADATVDGTVRGLLAVVDGDANVTGTVLGDVWIADGTLRLGPSARVTGDVTLTGAELVMSEGAVVVGAVDRATAGDLAEAGRVAALFAWFSATLALLALTLLVVAVVGARPAAVVAAVASPARAALVGLALVILMPFAAGLAFATGVGFGVGALLLALLPGLLVAGLVVSALAVGTAGLARLRPNWAVRPWGPYAAAALGVVALQVLWAVPLLWLGAAYAALHGVGALVMSAVRRHDAPAPQAAPSELALG